MSAAIRRKLRPSAWAVVKNVGVFLGVAAIVLLAALVAFARILVVPAIVAMLIVATLYILGVVP